MNDEKQRIAIAEACGFHMGEDGRPPLSRSDGKMWGYIKKDILPIPDYLNSHDAMAEALETLTDGQWDRYDNEIFNIAVTDWTNAGAIARSVHNATPRQKAQAFLMTIGKWEEGE